MRPPDPRHLTARLAPCVVLVGLVAGCAAGSDETTRPTAPRTALAGEDDDGPGDSLDSADDSHGTTDATTEHVAAAAPAVGVVTVTGGDLPADIVDAYRTGGGDLVEPAEWTARYGTAGLPELRGPSIRLVEATRRAEHTGDGWERVDEAAWLAVATADRDDLLADLAATARLDTTPTRTTGTDNGGDCATDTYPPDRHATVWAIQGCAYPRYPQLVTLGVSRTGPDSEPPAPPDPTIRPLAELLDGQVSFIDVRLAAPGQDAATLHISARLDLPTGIEPNTAADLAVAGPLAGWQVLRGDESVLLSGPTGATWTIAEGVAVFDWAGRW